ncbi:MAG: M20/M25/M40 family metallo-hydrolase [Fimbriimonadaceae bacterium]
MASCEEEIGGEGVKRMRRELPTPSAAIIGEPNHMKPANCCKGVVLAEFTVKGESAHVSRPWQGGTLRLASPLIADIVTDHQLAEDPTLGPAAHEPTLIQGGHQKNALPAEFKIFLDCRTTPTFDNEAMKAHLQSIAARHPDCTLEILKDQVTPTRTDPDGRLVQAACKVAGLDAPNPFVGVCDFVYMSGIDAVIMGPGAPERSHKADEFLKVDELVEGAKLYQAVLNRYFFS